MTNSNSRPALFIFFCTAAVYLGCVSFIHYPLTTLLKPIPILALIIAVTQSNMMRIEKRLLLAALCFSLLGDIVLTLPISLQIELGIGYFLLAHCCYIALFLRDYQFKTSNLFYFLPALIYSTFMFYLIFPHLGALMLPVCVYFAILFFMVFCAYQITQQKLLVALGATSFLISDSILAYTLFVSPLMNLTLLVMSTYYVAQVLLVLGFLDRNTKNSNK